MLSNVGQKQRRHDRHDQIKSGKGWMPASAIWPQPTSCLVPLSTGESRQRLDRHGPARQGHYEQGWTTRFKSKGAAITNRQGSRHATDNNDDDDDDDDASQPCKSHRTASLVTRQPTRRGCQSHGRVQLDPEQKLIDLERASPALFAIQPTTPLLSPSRS
ncbi:uncharacterized protein UV8b_04904 [Ustilaginoidea virens]|uniref:Uncharacterized protein n=1 Tax=Ustilaginoidea virens TaxID=1159556 RepID=A0A8E5HSP5_USTVR|nr:uncharacterized protein UV8b_04904 [Ustilaginoidea virens]QUC20663.1 hypothetical protein UV8b_04904 [Ustilaginoidea virens]